jgi:hypothetical protein
MNPISILFCLHFFIIKSLVVKGGFYGYTRNQLVLANFGQIKNSLQLLSVLLELAFCNNNKGDFYAKGKKQKGCIKTLQGNG